jgi:hypothetical protein
MSAGKEVSGAPPAQLYLPDRAAIASAGLGGLRTLPTGAQSVLVQSLPRSASAGSDAPSFMLVYSERARYVAEHTAAQTRYLASGSLFSLMLMQ